SPQTKSVTPTHWACRHGSWRVVLFRLIGAERLSISNGAARHFQISRTAGERNFQTVSGAPGGLALDHRKDGDHACACDDYLLCLSLDPRARDAGAAPRSRSASRRAARSWDHGFIRGFI